MPLATHHHSIAGTPRTKRLGTDELRKGAAHTFATFASRGVNGLVCRTVGATTWVQWLWRWGDWYDGWWQTECSMPSWLFRPKKLANFIILITDFGYPRSSGKKQCVWVWRSPACEQSYVDLGGLNRLKGVTRSQIRVIHPLLTNNCLDGTHIQ